MRVLLSLLVCLSAAGCRSTGWRDVVAYRSPVKLGGCAVGDVDPSRAGAEIAVVSRDGEVIVVRREGERWTHEVVARTGGELIQCAVGDVDPTSPGDELVAVGVVQGGEEGGGAGICVMVSRSPDGWHVVPMFRDTDLLHAVCIADLDPERPGEEVLVAGASLRAHVLYRDGDGWKAERAGDLGGEGESAAAFDRGAVLACADGSVRMVARGASPEDGPNWTCRVLDKASSGQARIGASGATLVVAGDDGVLALLDARGRRAVYREPERLRGAVLADLDPSATGLEAATAGYSGRITVLYRDGDGWRPETVGNDPDRLHDLAFGVLPGTGPSPALVACGYSGQLHVVYR